MRLLLAVSGRALLERTLTTYLLLGIVTAVMFGGSGLHPRTITDAAVASAWFRLALFGGWLLITLPPATTIFASPAGYFLRSLPVPRAHPASACIGLLLLLELPWAVLWTIGCGPAWAAAATLAVAAGTVLCIARIRDTVDWGASAGVVAALVVGSPMLLSATSVAALLIATSRAWDRAPERSSRGSLILVAGPSLVALVLAYLVSLVRGHRVVLVRALLVWLGAAFTGMLYIRNNGISEIGHVTPLILAVSGIGALGVTTVMAAQLDRIARLGEDVITLGGAPRCLRGAATRVALLAIGAAAGSGIAAIAATGAAPSHSLGALTVLLLAAGAMGAASGTLAAVVTEAAHDSGGRAAAWLIVALLFLSVAMALSTTLLPASGAVFGALFVAAAVGITTLDELDTHATHSTE